MRKAYGAVLLFVAVIGAGLPHRIMPPDSSRASISSAWPQPSSIARGAS